MAACSPCPPFCLVSISRAWITECMVLESLWREPRGTLPGDRLSAPHSHSHPRKNIRAALQPLEGDLLGLQGAFLKVQDTHICTASVCQSLLASLRTPQPSQAPTHAESIELGLELAMEALLPPLAVSPEGASLSPGQWRSRKCHPVGYFSSDMRGPVVKSPRPGQSSVPKPMPLEVPWAGRKILCGSLWAHGCTPSPPPLFY